MKKTTLTIVIPVYNEENYLATCLDAIARQTVQPDEVIVVDNNSTDKTPHIAASYPFVKLLHSKKQGVVYARNVGFDAVQSDIIGRIDADTVLDPNWVACAIQNFVTNPKLAALTGAGYWYDMPGAPGNYKVEHLFKGLLYQYETDFPFLFGSNMAISRKAWETIRPELCINKPVHEDLDIAIHLRQKNLFIYYDKNLRIGMSSRRYDDNPRDFMQYMEDYKDTYRLHKLPVTGARIAVASFWLGYVVLWPLRRSYNPETKTRKLSHLLRGGNKARPSPIFRPKK